METWRETMENQTSDIIIKVAISNAWWDLRMQQSEGGGGNYKNNDKQLQIQQPGIDKTISVVVSLLASSTISEIVTQ